MSSATKAQLSALLWFRNRGGDGVFDKNQVLTARGERGPVMRSTWSRLESIGFVERYMNNRRLRITDAGQRVNLTNVYESEASE